MRTAEGKGDSSLVRHGSERPPGVIEFDEVVLSQRRVRQPRYDPGILVLAEEPGVPHHSRPRGVARVFRPDNLRTSHRGGKGGFISCMVVVV